MAEDCYHDVCLDEPECLLEDRLPMCDVCDEPIQFLVYAAYDYPTSDQHAHPLVARYPGAMFRACSGCLAGLLRADDTISSTHQYVVKEVPS